MKKAQAVVLHLGLRSPGIPPTEGTQPSYLDCIDSGVLMPTVNCQLCGRDAGGDDAYVCGGCAGGATAALRQVAGDGRVHGLDVDLDLAVAKMGTSGSGGGGGRRSRSAESPLLINLAASEAADVLRSTLIGWVRVIHEETGGELPDDQLSAMASWLAPLVGWARHKAYGAELVDEVLAAVRQAQRAVDLPVRRVPLHRRCPAVSLDEGGRPTPCDGDLVALLAPGLGIDGHVRCTSGSPDHTTTVTAMTDRRRGARTQAVAPT
ncbi:hypothetical protein J4H86_21210 [Spiractinospora alimapuensis]|uniref:hypothetical protein n=1 Tax=Spiractinospora alimapuensis TaxID=2820884 RepID=UPI001F481DC3|nr:hypothetical protein [Spiractinospora alimapuensis]QVQ51310.1 hypothetical protein J4H86_21210 [Spiractinospora alimapuensis]